MKEKSLLHYKHFGVNFKRNTERKAVQLLTARHVSGAHATDPVRGTVFITGPCFLPSVQLTSFIHHLDPWYLANLLGRRLLLSCLSSSRPAAPPSPCPGRESTPLPQGPLRERCKAQGTTAQCFRVSGYYPDNSTVPFFSQRHAVCDFFLGTQNWKKRYQRKSSSLQRDKGCTF